MENGISRNVSGYLRGLAILIVLASHYAEWMYVEPAFPLIRHCIGTWGPPGVDIFFLLSGYGLYKSYKQSGGIDKEFVIKRLLAVYLPYLCLALMLCVYHGDLFFKDFDGMVEFFTAGEFWFLNVMLVMYLMFIVCFAFCGKAAFPLMLVLSVVHSIWLHLSGHMDFWTLSNHTFVLGAAAAAAEIRYQKLFTRRNLLIVTIGALAGAVVAFFVMQSKGGSGIDESYEAELVMNVFISIAVMAGAYLLPDIRLRLLGMIGEASLFIYVLHTTMFYAIIFKLEKLGYTLGTAVTGVITMTTAVLLFKLYSVFSKYILTRIKKK